VGGKKNKKEDPHFLPGTRKKELRTEKRQANFVWGGIPPNMIWGSKDIFSLIKEPQPPLGKKWGPACGTPPKDSNVSVGLRGGVNNGFKNGGFSDEKLF